MSGGEVAGLVVAVFWAVLVTLLSVVLVRLAGALRQATALVAAVTERTVPLLDEAAETLRAANDQLVRVDAITADVQDAAANAQALSSTMAATLGGPLVKLSAFSYGVRSAVARQRSSGVPERYAPQQTERELIERMVRTQVKAEVRAATAPRGVLARLFAKKG
ncbi:DUF948 domain-containing protein [Streptacidiphilus albus]|uniref:DUF948 domain-containing protein n=1 Tax=Streptacidiphilus albus TaxID=105425 RepID=UPI00054C7DDC|nr:DUF948 domain-containing protein [Streptacidiphilus albus]